MQAATSGSNLTQRPLALPHPSHLPGMSTTKRDLFLQLQKRHPVANFKEILVPFRTRPRIVRPKFFARKREDQHPTKMPKTMLINLSLRESKVSKDLLQCFRLVAHIKAVPKAIPKATTRALSKAILKALPKAAPIALHNFLHCKIISTFPTRGNESRIPKTKSMTTMISHRSRKRRVQLQHQVLAKPTVVLLIKLPGKRDNPSQIRRKLHYTSFSSNSKNSRKGKTSPLAR